MEIKGHNSDNNWWILPLIDLDLHFMIKNLYIKNESQGSKIVHVRSYLRVEVW